MNEFYTDESHPHLRKTGSSFDVSGWNWIFPSHKAADDREGSLWAGSDNDPPVVHLPATDVATNVGTMVISEDKVIS